jgi:hypothetical protein
MTLLINHTLDGHPTQHLIFKWLICASDNLRGLARMMAISELPSIHVDSSHSSPFLPFRGRMVNSTEFNPGLLRIAPALPIGIGMTQYLIFK